MEATMQGLGFGDIIARMENQMEKDMENEMDIAITSPKARNFLLNQELWVPKP